jgi:hypothetical protein
MRTFAFEDDAVEVNVRELPFDRLLAPGLDVLINALIQARDGRSSPADNVTFYAQADVLHRYTGVGLLEDRDDLGLGKPQLLHGTSWLVAKCQKVLLFGGLSAGGAYDLNALVFAVFLTRRSIAIHHSSVRENRLPSSQERQAGHWPADLRGSEKDHAFLIPTRRFTFTNALFLESHALNNFVSRTAFIDDKHYHETAKYNEQATNNIRTHIYLLHQLGVSL